MKNSVDAMLVCAMGGALLGSYFGHGKLFPSIIGAIIGAVIGYLISRGRVKK